MKTEIEGDVDSSYGSGPSFAHTNVTADRSFDRGVYLPWIVQEAKKRNPSVRLYALNWGLPAWVQGGPLSATSVTYHLDYLIGARDRWNVTYDVIGVWNERSWSLAYVKALRAALDAAGFNRTAISVNDGTDNTECTDCPSSWPDKAVSTAIARDPAFAAAMGVVGMHHGNTEGVFALPNWETAGKKYWNSENNDLDGPMPQWDPVSGNIYGSGLSWPRVVIVNYLRARATATVLCPATHSFTWNYGRENHGHTQIVEPWSGYYELGAGFWGQAHVTQFVQPGWRFLDGTGTGQWCRSSATDSCYIVWAAWLSPSGGDLTLVVVNTNVTAQRLDLALAGAILPRLAGGDLATWTSTSAGMFVSGPPAAVSPAGALTLAVPGRSVTTVTTVAGGRKAAFAVPPRAPFPLPFVARFDGQRVDGPGRFLSDLFGAFEVVSPPLPVPWHPPPPPTPGGDLALRQAAPANPERANSWLRAGEGLPFTSLPGGSNFANAGVSAAALLAPGAPVGAAVRVCGRVPIWQPATYASDVAPLGVCLAVAAAAGGDGAWQLTDTTPGGVTSVLANGVTPGFVGGWHNLTLAFDDDAVDAAIDGARVGGAAAGLHNAAGVAGLGTSWHDHAYFDDVSLGPGRGGSAPAGSWLHDVLPGEAAMARLAGGGWAGFVLDLGGVGAEAVTIRALGRFRARGNSGAHAMDVVRASDGVSMLDGQALPVVDLSRGGCAASDVMGEECMRVWAGTGGVTSVPLDRGHSLIAHPFPTTLPPPGFCYAALATPVTLPPGAAYYIVAAEPAAGDIALEMTNPAAGTTHTNRDGEWLVRAGSQLSGPEREAFSVCCSVQPVNADQLEQSSPWLRPGVVVSRVRHGMPYRLSMDPELRCTSRLRDPRPFHVYYT